MFVEMTPAAAVRLLGNATRVLDERIVPADTRDPGHSPYRPGYEWLFFYERALARKLDPWLQQHRPVLFGSRGILSEALSNAFCHGNNRQSSLAIHVEVDVGARGLLITIGDAGRGFDVETLVSRAQRGRRHAFHNAGNGLRAMADAEAFGIFYSDGGRRCHVLYLDSGVAAWAPV